MSFFTIPSSKLFQWLIPFDVAAENDEMNRGKNLNSHSLSFSLDSFMCSCTSIRLPVEEEESPRQFIERKMQVNWNKKTENKVWMKSLWK